MTRRIGAVAGFCVLALMGTLTAQVVWTGLLVTNLKVSPAVPWSVIVMALVLSAIWRYFGGAGWPSSTQEARRHYRRDNPVTRPAFGLAMVAGLLALGGLIALWLVLVQLVKVPGNPSANFADYSPLTIVTVVVMASIVGAVTEELGLRGYMLTRLEGSVGGSLAVVIAAIVISPGHGMTQGFLLPTLLWYFLADLTFGGLAVLTGSIRPGIVIHAIGLLTFFSLIWPTDKYRHAASLGNQPAEFWVESALCIVFTASALVAFRQLASIKSTVGHRSV